MRIIETQYGLFLKRRGKLFEYVGSAWMELPILTAKQTVKLQNKANQIEAELEQSDDK